MKKRHTRIELPELNAALVETYHEPGKATRATKDMATNCKLARQQAKTATNLWKASQTQKTELEQQLQGMGQTTSLTLPPLTSKAQEASTQTNCVELVKIATQTDPTNLHDHTTIDTQTEEDFNMTIHNYE